MLLDVFKDDAFHFTKLTTAITKMPYQPTRIGRAGLFSEEGVSTLTVAIEMQNGVLTLVPTAERGAPGVLKGAQRRNVRDFRTVHLPQRVTVMADEVANLRAFGSESEVETALGYLNKKAAVARRDLDLTHEYQRVGAIKGVVLDADGTTVIYNWLNEFGLSQTTHVLALGTSSTKVVQEVTAAKRKSEDKLGNVMASGYRVFCGSTFFDALTSHPAVKETYLYQQGNVLRQDRRDGFEFGTGVWWEEYRGSVGGTPLIAAGEAWMVPEGVPDLFKTFFSPAPYMETVNTVGLPFYMKEKAMDYNVGVEWQIQSNPLHVCTRPDAIIKLTLT